jgi:hypothetical protein
MSIVRSSHRATLLASAAIVAGLASAHTASAGAITGFTANDLVISTVSGSVLDTATPIMLDEFKLGTGGTSATSVGTLTLPQTSSGVNSAISGVVGQFERR